MSGVVALNLVDSAAEAVDDCWNRIGITGDKSCPLLAEHIHCRNCQVYAAAALRLLDRYALEREEQVVEPAELPATASQSLLVFRLRDEWLALPTRCLSEVAAQQPVHSLPHQRSRALLGVANVRGALVPCLDLVDLLGIDAAAAFSPINARITPRLLLLTLPDGPVVVPVDEVDGIHRIDQARLESASSPGSQAGARFTRAVLALHNRSVRVIDEAPLLAAMSRSLT